MRVQRCKGTQDQPPAEMAKFRLIESAFRDSCLKWGYEEVRTPTLEYLHLFTATGTLTPSMLHKVYSFLDWDGWSGERVVLRPDGTIPVARFYIDNISDKGQAKLFYVTNVFRFERTMTETGERWQCGAELIGASSATADVELIMIAREVLSQLGITGVELRLSHAGVIRALLTKLGLSPGEQAKIFDQFLNGGIKTLTDIRPESSKLDSNLVSLLSMKGKSSRMLKNLKNLVVPNSPEIEPSLNNFIDIVDLIEALGYDYQIDIDSGRGFEYYTGMIFQLFAGDEKIGGGGRYDALIPTLGGKDTPASGFALYVDRLMKLLPPETVAEVQAQKILIRAEPGVVKKGFNIANRLHQAGYRAAIKLGTEESNVRWVLDVRSQAPVFALTDRVKQRRFEMQTNSEVLAILGEESANKSSPA